MIHSLMEFGHILGSAIGLLVIAARVWSLADPRLILWHAIPEDVRGVLWFIGLILGFLLVVWIITRPERRSRRDYPRCAGCDYNLTGHQGILNTPNALCPECGLSLSGVHVVPAGLPNPRISADQSIRLAVLFAMIWTSAILLYAVPHFVQAWSTIAPLIAILWAWVVLVSLVKLIRG